MKISVYNTEGKEIDTIDISKKWEKVPVAQQAIRDTVVCHLANLRRGTASTKTRSELSYSTRKPWRQKGTGRARVGTRGSPIWRKGGRVFGPKPRDFSIKLPKKVKRLALKSVVGDKVNSKQLVIVDRMELDKPKTKTLYLWLKNLDGGPKPLIVSKDTDRNLFLSVRNIAGVGFSRVSDLNTYTVLAHGKIIVIKNAWKILEKRIFS